MNIENIDETRSRRDYNRYIISYNSVLPLASAALKPAVLLETSYTAVSFPTVMLPVHSYIGDMMEKEAPDSIEEFMLLPFSMKVQGNLTTQLLEEQCSYEVVINSLKDIAKSDIFK